MKSASPIFSDDSCAPSPGNEAADQSFFKRFRAECIEGSAIAPALFDAAVEFTEEERGGEVHALLGWRYARFGHQVPHSLGSFTGFRQEDGELWQGKAENPTWNKNKQRFDKYVAPKGIGSKAFLPTVPREQRRAIAKRYGCEVPPVDESFWAWLAQHPETPILLTEGGKKGLCGLSHGYAAVAGFGVDAFSRKGENQLLPELMPFVHPKRQWVIAFDEDSKRKTRRRVQAATRRLGRYLVQAGNTAKNIAIAQWELSQGKGLDDLVVQSGADALHQAVAQAMPLPAWKRGGWDAYLKSRHPEIFSLTHEPAIRLAQRYLPSLQLPQAGSILATGSAMGTGKTEVMKGFISQARAIDGDCLIELIGYRNSLGMQSAERLGIDHIHLLEKENGVPLGLAYCLDSLHRRIGLIKKEINPTKRKPRKVLLLLDEIDAVLKHLFLGSTLGKRRADIMLMLCDLLKRVCDSGGWIVCGEADLTSLPIAFLEAVTGKAAQVVVNSYQGMHWEIEAPIPTNTKGEPSHVLAGKAAIARIIREMEQGKRVAASTDSATWGRMLERMAKAQGYKVERLDSTTAETEYGRIFMAAPDVALEREKPQLFIYTPTAESGLSITGDHFDVMVAYGSHLEHRALIQLMGRIRAEIPRVIYCREAGLDQEADRVTNPAALLKDWKLNARYSAMGAQLGDNAPDLQLEGLALTLHGFAAKYQTRISASKSRLRGSLLETLTVQGHQITQPQELPLDEAFKEALAELKEEFELEGAEEFVIAKDTYTNHAGKEVKVSSPDEARYILSSPGATRLARVVARKIILSEAYPGIPVNNIGFVRRNITGRGQRGLAMHKAMFLAQNPKVAQEIDRLCWEQQTSAKMLWLPSIKREAPKATLIAQSGLLELLELEEYQESSPEVERVKNFATHYQADIKRVLGLWCSEEHTGIQIVNKLAKKLGHAPRIARKVGPRGAQIKVWGWSTDLDADRAVIHAALLERWADVLADVDPVDSISDSNTPITKNEATEAETTVIPPFERARARWLRVWENRILNCPCWEHLAAALRELSMPDQDRLWVLLGEDSPAMWRARMLWPEAA